MNETDAYRKFSKEHKGWFKKLHGNKFQAGLPDVIWLCKGSEPKFLEFKICDRPKVPWSKFRLNQHLTMLQMVAESADVFYVIYVKSEGRFLFVRPEEVIEEKGVDLTDRCVV
jgi:hypothetical protein